MKNLIISKKIIIVLIPFLSLYFGFLFDEDLSTGGAKLDFYSTLPAVVDLSNFIFINFYEYTRHFPLHYFIVSIPYSIFGDVHTVRMVYLLFSLLLPTFVYLNISKIYSVPKINCLIISSSLLLLPFFRTSAIWPNAHLTAIVFLVISNYFYIKNTISNSFYYKFANIFFLSLATYCIQSYAVFFLFYLLNYYQNNKKKNFFYILIFCFLFSLPGFYLIFNNPRFGLFGLAFSNNLSYTIITNFSIIFFFIIFFLVNKNNFLLIKKYFFKLSFYEIFILIFLFFLLILGYKEIGFSVGGGFFYKLSLFLFQNKIIFYLTGFLGLLIFYLFYKNEKKIFYILILLNLTSMAYYTSQKYFEPLLIVSFLIFYQNFLSKNIINTFKNALIFYIIIFIYFIIAVINNGYEFSKLST